MDKVRGIAVGTVRQGVPLYEPLSDEELSKLSDNGRRIREKYRNVTIDVRRQRRRDVREFGILWASLGRSLESLDPSTLEPEDDPLHKMHEAMRAFLLSEVISPRGGVNLGTVLVRVRGIEVEYPGGDVMPLEELSGAELVEMLGELDLLDAVVIAAMRGQDPTPEQKN
jgi:hypothetical protein